jgi:XTP/dITP diphosphohydrolase
MDELILAAATGNPDKVREIQAVLGPLGVRVVTAADAGAPGDFAPEENGKTFEENSRIKAAALIEAISDYDKKTKGDGSCVYSDTEIVSLASQRRLQTPLPIKTQEPSPFVRIDGVIADDSGLCVDAIGGAPGVYSARFANKKNADNQRGEASAHDALDCREGEGDVSARNNAKLLGLLEGKPNAGRTARFVCVITLMLLRGGGASSPKGPYQEGVDAVREIVCRGECEGHIATSPRGEGGFGYDSVFVPVADGSEPRTFAEMTPDEKNAISHRARALTKLYDILSERAQTM